MSLSYIEISSENLKRNVQSFRSLLDEDVKVAAVVKANAYGHGIKEVVRAVEDEVDYFQVDDLDELRRLREVSNAPTLVLGYIESEGIREALSLGCELAVYDSMQLQRVQEAANRLGVVARVHIAIDSHLGREGTLPNKMPNLLNELKAVGAVEVVGAYAHFANIEDTSDFTHAQKQLDEYAKIKNLFRSYGFDNLIYHISATSGILAYEHESHDNRMVRLGVGLYGIWPSEDLKARFNSSVTLKPALRWVTRVAQVKELPTNHTVGYGLTYVTREPKTVALIPQGYSDGYDRGLSNTGCVLIRGSRCRVLGRVAMNMFIVDVSDLPEVCPEDEAVLLGTQGDEAITAEELAGKAGTINYEIIARISSLLERVSA